MAVVGDVGVVDAMNADGTGQTEVTDVDGRITDLRWLPRRAR